LVLNGSPHFAEVVYFFLIVKDDLQYTLMAVSLYSQANSGIFEESYQTNSIHTYLGNKGIHIIDAKWITEVVDMIPLKHGRTDKYFVLEKISLVASRQQEEDDTYLDTE
ncbi:hypothetical protein BJV74DRAFT_785757, partial [Russula compacta]